MLCRLVPCCITDRIGIRYVIRLQRHILLHMTLLSYLRSARFSYALALSAVVLLLQGCGTDQQRSSSSATEQAPESSQTQADNSTEGELAPDEYTVTVEGQAMDDDRVQVNVRTNIPGVIELMASISLADQAPDDVFIGKTERITVRDGSGQTTFDVSDLPQGEYEAEASFYPNWGFQDEQSKATGITEPIESKYPLTLDGSGESAESVSERNEGQRWVMENVTMGMTWNPTEWKQRFGDWKEFATTSRNPDVITNYYFESIDMTIVVNTVKNEIVTWRTGRDGL